ncbi:MAG: SMI1/KNR4 family protein [Candidatus Thorarchaeota archaeon]
MHIKELLYFKDMVLPNYLKLFYEQTNGILIESEYFIDDLDDPSHLLVNSCENLFFTNKNLNLLPDNRFISFATNDDETLYLLDCDNLDPESNPLILLNNPIFKKYIPLTNSIDVFLECACLGILGIIESFVVEQPISRNQIPVKTFKKKERILYCLKKLFETAKREYELLEIWHIDQKVKPIIQTSFEEWFKEIKRLVTIFQ